MSVRKPRKRVLEYLNFSKHAANHLIGQHHTIAHRMVFGVVIMVGGVLVSKAILAPLWIHIICDVSGYGLHGIGLIPFIEHIMDKHRKNIEQKGRKNK